MSKKVLKQVEKKYGLVDEALFSAELELEELQERIARVSVFLKSLSERLDGGIVVSADAGLLGEQLTAMGLYSDCLRRRIERFKSIRECIVSVI